MVWLGSKIIKEHLKGPVGVIMDTCSTIFRGSCVLRYFLFVFVFLGGVRWGEAQRPAHIVRPPPVRGERDVALIVVTEVGLENTAYEELADVLQAESAIPLWVCLLDTKTNGPPTADSLGLSVMFGLEMMRVKGMNADRASIFIAGHGRGGDIVASYVNKVPGLYRGVILFGTYLKPKFKASEFPVPIMTISGDLDGISRLTRAAEAFRSIATDVAFDAELIYYSPFIIMDGFNHGVYSSGELPGPMQSKDIDSEGTIEDGQRLVANSTGLFMAYTLNYPTSFVEVAKIQLKQAFEKAQFITKPILEIKDMTKNSLEESYFIRVAQKWLSGLQGNDSTRLKVESYIVGDATEIPPSMLAEGDMYVVITFSDVLYSRRRDREEWEEEDPEEPVEIAARMLSPERINQMLKNTTIAKSYTCMDLNYGSYQTAYHTASETARRRFKDKNRGVLFHTDMMVHSDIAWKLSQIIVETKRHEMHVTAISYMTPNIEKLGEQAGLYYCKILPPDRALEWIYVDSLRRNMPS